MVEEAQRRRIAGTLVLAALVLALPFGATSCGLGGRGGNGSKSRLPVSRCPIDGAPTRREVRLRRPIGVMVENLSAVRPQSGLDKACIVFEALAEGGITRFLAVYLHRDAPVVGPVRSARTHFVALIRGFDGIYGHCGASVYAERAIKRWDVTDFDQFKHAAGYWRSAGAAPPHNLFAATGQLRKAAGAAGIAVRAGTQLWPHKPDAPVKKRGRRQRIFIDFSYPAYRVEYRYDARANRYRRWNGGEAHRDASTGKQLAPTTVVVIVAHTGAIEGGGGVLDVDVIGSGRAVIFRDGRALVGRWRKQDSKAQVAFLSAKGNRVAFDRGQIWVEIVPSRETVRYSK